MNAFDRIARRGLTLGAGAATALALAPAALAESAAAAAITADKACYVNRNPMQGAAMTIAGTGFVAGDPVTLAGGTVSASTTVAADGTFSVRAQAPKLPTVNPASASTTLIATDKTTTGTPLTASTTVQSANLAVATKPGSVRNVGKDEVTFSFSGFTPGKHIYGYYLRKKIVAKTKFGKANGACGVLHQRALLYPGGHPTHGSYGVAFESVSRYSKNAFPRVTGALNIINL